MRGRVGDGGVAEVGGEGVGGVGVISDSGLASESLLASESWLVSDSAVLVTNSVLLDSNFPATQSLLLFRFPGLHLMNGDYKLCRQMPPLAASPCSTLEVLPMFAVAGICS